MLIPNEHYEYLLQASAGATRAILIIRSDGTVESDFRWSGMGNGYHYRLSGKRKIISESYGWISIQQVEDMMLSSAPMIPIQAFGTELIYEYIKLPKSPFLQHPEDMLWMAARWHETFDLLLFANRLVCESLDSLQYVMAEGILEETYPAEMLVHINDDFVAHLTNLIVGLDKLKFTRIEQPVE